MLTRLLDHALRNRFWVFMTITVIVVVGTYSVSQLSIGTMPDITNVQVVVNTKTGALDPEQIEKSVTYPIETEMSGLPGVSEIRSLSKYGLSQVSVVFEEGTDIYKARQWVSERLQNVRADLPGQVSPELGPVTTGLGEVFMYAVMAKEGSELSKKDRVDQLIHLRTVQDYTIRPQLKKIKGAADVDSNGGYVKEIHINLDFDQMARYSITVEQLVNKLNRLGQNFGGGYIQHNKRQIIVRTSGEIDSLEQIKRMPVKLSFLGAPIRLDQIADMRVEYSQRLGAATYNGQEAVLGTVLMRVGANSRMVSIRAKEQLEQINLPDDVKVKILYNRSFLVDATINTVTTNLAEGALLVILVLLLILGNFRASVLVSLAIPLSMLVALAGMHYLDIPANLMSLGAIDFGLLVDGSIVMVENYLYRLEQDPHKGDLTRQQRMSLMFEAGSEVVKPVVIGLVIIMAVYIPILSLDGVEGKMFHPMAITVVMALAASLFVALMLMPTMAYLVISGKGSREPLFFRWVQKAYRPLLVGALRFKKSFLAASVLILLMSLGIFLRMGSDFVPQLDEGDLVIGLVRDTDIAIDESIEQQKKAEKIIAAYPEVRHVFSRLGTPESATDPMGVNFADTFVILEKDRSKWPEINGERRSKQELYEAIAQEIDKKLPGHEISATQPIEMRFNEILEGSRADITLRILGPNLKKLMGYVSRAKKIVRDIPGTSSVEEDPLTALTTSPVLDVNMDVARLLYYGLSLQEVNHLLEMVMGGYELGKFNADDLRFPIVMHLDERYRDDIGQIRNIPVGLPDGGTIPINRVAEIKMSKQVTTIARRYAKRYGAISIYIKGRDVASFVAEAKSKINKEMDLPENYTTQWGGQFKNLKKARNRLLIIVPAILLFIFLLLYRTLDNLRETILIYLAIPFAMTGGVLILYFRGMHFSVSAAVGFIALSGIAILNGMVLVSRFNSLRESGLSVRETAWQGAFSRLRPVLMTALVASLGFLPMAMNTGLGAEVQRPLATVVVGGLITSTVLTLLLIPMLYTWLEERREKGSTTEETED